jgi:hypothetical protein
MAFTRQQLDKHVTVAMNTLKVIAGGTPTTK